MKVQRQGNELCLGRFHGRDGIWIWSWRVSWYFDRKSWEKGSPVRRDIISKWIIHCEAFWWRRLQVHTVCGQGTLHVEEQWEGNWTHWRAFTFFSSWNSCFSMKSRYSTQKLFKWFYHATQEQMDMGLSLCTDYCAVSCGEYKSKQLSSSNVCWGPPCGWGDKIHTSEKAAASPDSLWPEPNEFS